MPDKYIEKVFDLEKEIAIVVRNKFSTSSIEFLSEKSDLFQLGFLKRSKGYKVPKHHHPASSNKITQFSELIQVKSGKILVSVFSRNTNHLLAKKTLHAGDLILQKEGVHAVEFLETSEIMEVKQGPYLGKKSKIYTKNNL